MTPADLLALDLEVDKAIRGRGTGVWHCTYCGQAYAGKPGLCSACFKDAGFYQRPSRAWSTDPEAVGEMMQWLAAQGVWVVVQHTPDGAMDWSIIADTPCLGRSTSLPHALALAVVEVARRKGGANADPA